MGSTAKEEYSEGTSSKSNGELNGIKEPYNIPTKFQNSLGFIDYGREGELPWKESDIRKGEISLPLPAKYTSATDVLGIDCEMVGVGRSGKSALGRVSIVNLYGYCIYNTFAKPTAKVTDYRTKYSGIKPRNLVNAPVANRVIKKVAEIVDCKVLIGHSIRFDLDVLKLNNHPKDLIRDTAEFFQNELRTKQKSSLKDLISKYFNCNIQEGKHNSIEDAQAALKLYLMKRDKWENPYGNLTLLECGHYQELTERQLKNFSVAKCTTFVKRVLPCGHSIKWHCHQFNDEKGISKFECKKKCLRKCTHGVPCPGDHQCFTNCAFTSTEKLTPFVCGHGLHILKCCNFEDNNYCPNCQSIVLQIQIRDKIAEWALNY